MHDARASGSIDKDLSSLQDLVDGDDEVAFPEILTHRVDSIHANGSEKNGGVRVFDK